MRIELEVSAADQKVFKQSQELSGDKTFSSFIRGINPTVVLPSNLSPGMYVSEVSHPRFGPIAEPFFVK